MMFRTWSTVAAFLVLSLPQLAHAGIPSGPLQIQVTDPTNHLWDATSIPDLQNLELEISDENADIEFAAPFTQTGTGKLTGTGLTQMDVSSPIFVGTVTDAVYKATGALTSSKGVARLRFTGTAKGSA